MTDHFAALEQSRRPWLDADALKEKFHALSATVHPDRLHNADTATRQQASEHYANLNAAYQCLRQPKTRLEHLFLLETGAKPGDLRAIPEDIMQFFSEVGMLLRETNSLLAEKSSVTSPILKVNLLERSMPYLERISKLQALLQVRLREAMDELRTLDSQWDGQLKEPTQRAAALQSVERLYHLYGFLERWSGQLQERSFQLTV